MSVPVTPLARRLWRRLDRTTGGCWLWTGATSADGYGRVCRGVRGSGTALAHRAVYELLVGPVPAGLDLDHVCRVRACCNPDHLEPVTRAENVARGAHARGWAERERTHCIRGHAYTPENTIRKTRERVCRTCHNELARARRVAASVEGANA